MRVGLAIVFAAVFAAVATIDAAGGFDAPDSWAVRNAMPGLDAPRSSKPSVGDALTPVHEHDDGWLLAADAWLYPASAPPSALLVGSVALALWRRGRRRAALLWPAALVAGVAVEVLVKHVVRRPALHAEEHHLVAFDGSLPSGHTLRALVVAAAVAFVWRRVGAAAAIWAATVPPLLVVAGWHTPSDVLAGAVLAGACVATVLALRRPQ